MLKTIQVKTVMGICEVKAVIIGKCAVHPVLGEDRGYSVTHINSGYALASYSSLKVASKYAIDVQTWVDLDDLQDKLLSKKKSKETERLAIQIKLRMLHKTFLYMRDEIYGIDKIAPGWVDRHPNNMRSGNCKAAYHIINRQ